MWSPRPALPAALSAALLLTVGCASPWQKEYLDEISGDGVFLYRQYELVEGQRKDKGYLHPAEIAEQKMKTCLSRLVYLHEPFLGTPTDTRIFTNEEVDRLARRLVVGLKTIKPDERLRFLVPRRDMGSFLTGTSGVSGVVFRTRAESLDIAFDTIHQGIHEGEYGSTAPPTNT